MNVTNRKDSDESLRRNQQGPKRGLIEALLIIMLTYGGVAMAQQPRTNLLEQSARSSQSGDATAVRVFTDMVISYLPVTFHPALSMNDRLFQAELRYRQHSRSGINVGQLVSVLNQLAEDLMLPGYVKTNANQVGTYRMQLVRVYPALFGPHDLKPTDLSLSPSAATFLIFQLLQLKLIDPSYQTDPDLWVRNLAARRAQTAPQGPSHSFTFGLSTSPLLASPDYQSIANGLATNSGLVVGRVLLMFSALGI